MIPPAQAMYDGSVRLPEITYSANGKVSDGKAAENMFDVYKIKIRQRTCFLCRVLL